MRVWMCVCVYAYAWTHRPVYDQKSSDILNQARKLFIFQLTQNFCLATYFTSL